MPEKVLIIGLGQIGMGYDLALDPDEAIYSHARAFSAHPAFELSCAVDPNESQRDQFIQHYSQPAYADLESALNEKAASVVVIASPTVNHSKTLATVLANSNPKVILCEKPLAYDLNEARRMVEACEKSGVKLFVNYIRRTDPGAIEVKHLIDRGEIVGPIKGVVWYSKGFLHNGSHFFNLLEFWLGAFVKAKMLDAGRVLGERDYEPDVQVEFERGKVVFLAAREEAYSHYTIELVSPAGRLRYEKGGELIVWQSTQSDEKISSYNVLRDVPDIIPNDMNRYAWNVADHLAEAIAGKPHSLCTGRQALHTLEAMHQIIAAR
ncbi:MAG: Gfo/Idh/MocA family oxidoreductase [Gallionellaceae bacterium]|jgi:predicted dehydrogenase